MDVGKQGKSPWGTGGHGFIHFSLLLPTTVTMKHSSFALVDSSNLREEHQKRLQRELRAENTENVPPRRAFPSVSFGSSEETALIKKTPNPTSNSRKSALMTTLDNDSSGGSSIQTFRFNKKIDAVKDDTDAILDGVSDLTATAESMERRQIKMESEMISLRHLLANELKDADPARIRKVEAQLARAQRHNKILQAEKLGMQKEKEDREREERRRTLLGNDIKKVPVSTSNPPVGGYDAHIGRQQRALQKKEEEKATRIRL